ncbi:MAG TPA: hypothetical protein VMX13_02375 [Sedimentisphaerales bacterium]|nr:hypothetical protein [Sedimentisphaerales bacterium]
MMDKEEEILRLLHEIRDTQREHHEEWKKVVDESVIAQKEHEQEWRKARDESLLAQKQAIKKNKYYMLILLLIFACGLFLLNFPFLEYLGRGFTPETSILGDLERHEARQWLRTNKNVSPLASNRFGTKEKAVAFVEQLYEAGAETVYVTNIQKEDWRIKDEGGPYADAVIVVLPEDKEKRQKLFEICRVEAEKEGFEGMKDMGQKELFFWWD